MEFRSDRGHGVVPLQRLLAWTFRWFSHQDSLFIAIFGVETLRALQPLYVEKLTLWRESELAGHVSPSCSVQSRPRVGIDRALGYPGKPHLRPNVEKHLLTSETIVSSELRIQVRIASMVCMCVQFRTEPRHE